MRQGSFRTSNTVHAFGVRQSRISQFPTVIGAGFFYTSSDRRTGLGIQSPPADTQSNALGSIINAARYLDGVGLPLGSKLRSLQEDRRWPIDLRAPILGHIVELVSGKDADRNWFRKPEEAPKVKNSRLCRPYNLVGHTKKGSFRPSLCKTADSVSRLRRKPRLPVFVLASFEATAPD